MRSKPLVRTVARSVVVAFVLLGAGCAMRVSGVVRDGATGAPMGGAVLTANDGRDRMATTDPLGRFNVKTDWKSTILTVSAPGYQTVTITVPGNDRYPVLAINLPPTSQARTQAGSSNGAEFDEAEAQLKQLLSLHDRGLISDEEYKRMRSRLIGRL